MSISLNGNMVDPDLDVYKDGGCDSPYMKIISAKATASGKIAIGFDSVVNDAIVSYIEISRASS